MSFPSYGLFFTLSQNNMEISVAGPEEEEEKREERTITIPNNSKVTRGLGEAGRGQGETRNRARWIGERGHGELRERGREHRYTRLDDNLAGRKRIASELNGRQIDVGNESLAGVEGRTTVA